MEKDYHERWEIIGELGKGGQGVVYQVLDKSRFDVGKINDVLGQMPHFMRTDDQSQERVQVTQFKEAVMAVIGMEDPKYQGALKVLQTPEDARNPEQAEARLQREIEAMADLSHPSLLKIIDSRPEDHWFVSRFYPRGSLERKKPFTGDFVAALRAFRPLVEGVARLHKDGLIHRDIKPKNIFIDDYDHLVLGDFGLAFSVHDEKTRLTELGENVGTRDYMPAWALNKRIEELNFSFDVFSLGKTLYAMIRGSVCPLWYYDRDGWELNKTISDSQHLSLANLLFSKCVVQEEENCLGSAGDMLSVIDQVLESIDGGVSLIKGKIHRKCKVCGVGKYVLNADRGDINGMGNFGFNRVSSAELKIFICGRCGHVQLFQFEPRKDRDVWKK